MRRSQRPVPNPRLSLSNENFLVYIMRSSGVRGRVTSGSIEKLRANRINVYDVYGALLEYFSGDALRSWCVLDLENRPLDGWHDIAPEDAERFIPPY
jgi:hypothetical protein